jgi:hypothetical protein
MPGKTPGMLLFLMLNIKKITMVCFYWSQKIGLKPISQKATLLLSGAAVCWLASCKSIQQVSHTCDSLRDQVVEMTEKDRASRGFALVKIYEPTQVSKTDGELKCTGKASWSDGDETGIAYRSYTDREGEQMLEYEVVE